MDGELRVRMTAPVRLSRVGTERITKESTPHNLLGVSQGQQGVLDLGADQLGSQLDSSIIIEIATFGWWD